MLATPGALPDDPDRWAYEFKWDGIRAVVHWIDGSLTATTRNGNDVLHRFPELGELAPRLARGGAIIDGEIVALDENGIPDFGLLQHRTATRRGARRPVPVAYLAFDLLAIDKAWIGDERWDVRRDALEALDLMSPHVAVPPAFRGIAADVVADESRRLGLEGVVAKLRTGRYRPGIRSPDWIKVKNLLRRTSSSAASPPDAEPTPGASVPCSWESRARAV